MPLDPENPSPRPWPAPARWGAGVAAALHLSAVAVHLFGNRSGPWVVPAGAAVRYPPPAFVPASVFHGANAYLETLRLDETGRFPSLYAAGAAARVEAFGPDGETRGGFPEPGAWWPVRRRQEALAVALLTDVAALPDAAGERSYLPGRIPERLVWRADREGLPVGLVTVPEHELARDPGRRDLGPTPWQLAVAQSYAMKLGGLNASLRRSWTNPVPLSMLFAAPAATPDAARAELAPLLAERSSDYGKAAADGSP